MKTLIILIFNVTMLFISVNAQPKTPKCTSVVYYYTIPEQSQSWIDATNAYVQGLFPNATLIDDASTTYNCHAYA